MASTSDNHQWLPALAADLERKNLEPSRSNAVAHFGWTSLGGT